MYTSEVCNRMRLKSSSAENTGSAQHDATCVTRRTKAKTWTVCNSWLASKQRNKAKSHYFPPILFICWSSFMVRGLWSRVKMLCCMPCCLGKLVGPSGTIHSQPADSPKIKFHFFWSFPGFKNSGLWMLSHVSAPLCPPWSKITLEVTL